MSASIPRAFGSRSLYFAGAYVALQLLRSGFMVAAFAGQRMGRNYAQLLAWSAIAAFGESILAIGATFAGLHWSASAVVALVVGFAVTVSLWWILAQPAAPVGAASAAVTLGSPALYLVGEALFKHAVTGRAPWPGLAGGAALALLFPVALVPTRLELSAAVALVALALAANIWTRPNRPRLL